MCFCLLQYIIKLLYGIPVTYFIFEFLKLPVQTCLWYDTGHAYFSRDNSRTDCYLPPGNLSCLRNFEIRNLIGSCRIYRYLLYDIVLSHLFWAYEKRWTDNNNISYYEDFSYATGHYCRRSVQLYKTFPLYIHPRSWSHRFVIFLQLLVISIILQIVRYLHSTDIFISLKPDCNGRFIVH